MFAVDDRLVVDESGEISERDEDRGFRPGRRGSGAGLSPGYSLRGAGEPVSRRGGGVAEGVECADSLSRPHILRVNDGSRFIKGASCESSMGVVLALVPTSHSRLAAQQRSGPSVNPSPGLPLPP